jgi:uncharacterized protein
MNALLRKYRTKMYPGGDVLFWKIDRDTFPGHELYDLFLGYLKLRNIHQHLTIFNLYQIANELSLDIIDRYKFLTTPEDKREAFILNRVRFQMHILQQEEKSKDFYHLN